MVLMRHHYGGGFSLRLRRARQIAAHFAVALRGSVADFGPNSGIGELHLLRQRI